MSAGTVVGNHRNRLPGWVAGVSVTGTGLLAVGAFWLSFAALRDFAARAGVYTPWVWPLIVDGLIVVATIAAVAMARRPSAWYPWLLLTGGAAVSITANAYHATMPADAVMPPGLAAVVASVPPVVLVAITHLTVLLTRHRPDVTGSTGESSALASQAREDAEPVSVQAVAAEFIVDYLTGHGGQANAADVTAAALAEGLSLDAVKHARARSSQPRIASVRGSQGWVWKIERAEGAQDA